MTKAALYCRVSTSDQKTDMQLNDIHRFCKERNISIYQEYIDNGISEKDELYLYQAKEVIDNLGRTYLQYAVYPGTFIVDRAFGNSSTVVNTGTGVIANIQENDFVVKK